MAGVRGKGGHLSAGLHALLVRGALALHSCLLQLHDLLLQPVPLAQQLWVFQQPLAVTGLALRDRTPLVWHRRSLHLTACGPGLSWFSALAL